MAGRRAGRVLLALLASSLALAAAGQLRGATAVAGTQSAGARRALLAEAEEKPHLQHVLHSGYMDNALLEQHLRNFTDRCGSIARLASIGRSVRGAPLWALEISEQPGAEQPKPKFKYVANMHGDEPTGRVLQLALAEWLCANWGSEPRAQKLVRGARLFLLPSLNPDGFAAKQRGNANHVDLNRDFPDPLELGFNNLTATGKEQPETLALMEWSLRERFVASASMHEGAYVANYPWDGSNDKSTKYAASPDDRTFVHLAKTYATLHPKMNASTEFEGGITNGAAWYPLWGGMQDWNYLAAGCMELTLELSQHKWPPPQQLPAVWADNLAPMLALPLAALFGGLRGFVSGAQPGQAGSTPLEAVIAVESIAHNVSSGKRFGDFYRPLAPGVYAVSAFAPGWQPATSQLVVPADGSGVVHNFTLLPAERSQQQAGPAGGSEASRSGLPRKFGAGGEPEPERQWGAAPPLISEGVWVNMMRTSLVFFLGCSMGLLGLYALLALRLVSLSRASALAGILPQRVTAR